MLRDALLDALAVLLPVQCAGCGADDRAVCGECRGRLLPQVAPRRLEDLVVFTALRYEDVTQRILIALKEEGRTEVARALAPALAVAVGDARRGLPIELAAVPTSRSAWAKRGYDPVRLLLQKAGLGASRVLLHVGGDTRQKTLAVEERAANRAGTFVATRALDGRRFVIVDDVLTSGATLREAARAIRAAGGEVISGAALAYTPLKNATRDIHRTED